MHALGAHICGGARAAFMRMARGAQLVRNRWGWFMPRCPAARTDPLIGDCRTMGEDGFEQLRGAASRKPKSACQSALAHDAAPVGRRLWGEGWANELPLSGSVLATSRLGHSRAASITSCPESFRPKRLPCTIPRRDAHMVRASKSTRACGD
eukprot:15444336-Alexandrium_andersonii.AAC.1